ncbi:MAG: S8 family peptidase, partial [Muribaculaceae bacterium]|nr:S8 family peptidase [Muribaculaceae bacterium]
GRKYTVVVEFVDNIDYGDVAVEEVSSLSRFAVVNVTALQMEQLAELPQVKQISLGYEKNPAMNVARPACGVDAVQAGTDGLGKQYTGKGVVAGLFDVGLDVNHINFLDAEGEPRTKALWVYNSSGRESAYTTVSQIKNFTTENSSESHGTHVLGIMAGGYNGPAKYAVIANAPSQRAVFTSQDAANSAIPFYGVATEADLAVACGPLYDGNILAGIQRIVRYAESTKQPCVVNLSVGSTLGPHDGTDATTKYLAELGKRAIICIAAGNEGDENISIAAGYGEPVQTFVKNTTTGAATLQFWGSDNVPFTLRFIAYDRSKGKEVFSYTLNENLAGKSVRQSDMTGFSSALSGNITMSSNVDPSNNRYNVSVTVNVAGISSTIAAGFSIEPLDNQMVEGFAYNGEFASNSVPGFVSGNPDNSISNMACGENVIVVGSFTTAAQWGALNNAGTGAYINSYSPRPAIGAISSFSSYGTTFAGKSLPDVAAPGEGIMSSFSQYYVKNAPSSATQGWIGGEYINPDDDLMSRNSTWGLMQGTSMACPYVAGVIALWLEADPSLKYEDVMNIINETALNDFYTMDWPERFGAGKIDALAGIKSVIAGSGISDVAADDKGFFVTDLDGRNFEIYVPGAGKVAASLYSLSGTCVAGATASGNTVNLGAENVVPGVYVVKISADNISGTKKIVIR